MTTPGDTLRRRDVVEAVVFAGTDLALLFNDTNTDFPYVDCTVLHIKATLKGLWSEGIHPAKPMVDGAVSPIYCHSRPK